MAIFGHVTPIATGPTDGLPSFDELACALLLTVPQLAFVVGLVTWTWTEAPGPRFAGPNVRTPAEIVHAPVVPAASIAQLRPAPVGKVSETVALCAVPAPVFDSVM